MIENKEYKLEGISGLFKLAGISILIMNAKLLGDTLYLGLDKSIGWYEFLIFTAVGLSALETINNWASINQYIEYYDSVSLFAIDILTLGLLFEQAYVLTKMAAEDSAVCITTRVKYLLITYIMLYALYMLWNCLICRNQKVSKEKKEKIIKVTHWRVAQLVFGLLVAGVLVILESCIWIEDSDIWEYLWIWTTGVYLSVALLILFFSQKLIGVLRTAMEVKHTV